MSKKAHKKKKMGFGLYIFVLVLSIIMFVGGKVAVYYDATGVIEIDFFNICFAYFSQIAGITNLLALIVQPIIDELKELKGVVRDARWNS